MPKRRTRYEIYAELLDLVSRKGFSRVTRASYGANLPVDRAKEALNFLATRGFLKKDDLGDSAIYRITNRGREYLETFRHMRKLFAALDQKTLSRQIENQEEELMSRVEATLSTRKKNVKVNEDFSLEIRLINRGNINLTLKKIEGISPESFIVRDKPKSFLLREGYLDTSSMTLEPKKSVEIRLVLRPCREGILPIKFKIVYFDYAGHEYLLELERVTLNVVGDATRRLGTGFEDLDKLLLGGIPERYSIILTSPSCDERDLLTLRFLGEGIDQDEVTFYITSDTNILKHYMGRIQPKFNVFLFNPQADSLVQDYPYVFKLKNIDNLTEINITFTSAFRKITRTPKFADVPKRAYFEILSDILLQHGAVRTRKWLNGILAALKSEGFTSLMLLNPQMHSAEEVQAVLDPFEGEINIYEREIKGVTQKYLRIKRMLNQRYLENEMQLIKEKLRV